MKQVLDALRHHSQARPNDMAFAHRRNVKYSQCELAMMSLTVSPAK